MLKKVTLAFFFTGIFSLHATPPATCPSEDFEKCLKTFDITLVAFHNDFKKIEKLANFVGQQKSVCLIVGGIYDAEQKKFFNIIKPTIIYYLKGKEVTRSTNFDLKDVEHHIDYYLNAYVQNVSFSSKKNNETSNKEGLKK